jgi:Xaa-Pro aminopeptidase
VGLEVHDSFETGAPLEEGMVITVEPGLYLPEENIGIRIEDMVLVTKDGGQLLTSALPREAGEIEKALAK